MKELSAQKAIQKGIIFIVVPIFVFFLGLICFSIYYFIHFSESIKIGYFLLLFLGGMIVMIVFSNIAKKRWMIWAFNNTYEPRKLKRLSITYKFLNYTDEFYLNKFEKDDSPYGNTMKLISAINEQIADVDDLSIPDETIIEYDKSRKTEKKIFAFITLLLLSGLAFAFYKKEFLNKGALNYIMLTIAGFLAIGYWLLLVKKTEKGYIQRISLNKKGITVDEKLILWNEIKKARVYVSSASNVNRTKKRQLRFLTIQYKNGETENHNIKILPIKASKFEHLMALYKLRSLK